MCPVHRALSAKVRVRSQVSPRWFVVGKVALGRSQWPRGLRRRSAASRLLRLWVRIRPEAWVSAVFATGWSLVQRSPPDCGASLCVYKPRGWGGPGPLGAVAPKERKWHWDRFLLLSESFAISIIPPTLHPHSPTNQPFPNAFVRRTHFNSVNIYGTHTYICFLGPHLSYKSQSNEMC